MTTNRQHPNRPYDDLRPPLPLDAELHLAPPFAAALVDLARRSRTPRRTSAWILPRMVARPTRKPGLGT